LKRKGPMCDIPALWATNAKPQIAAVISSITLDLLSP